MPTTESAGFVSGVVLAAGASQRMGEPKQLLRIRGRPLLRHVLAAALASRLDEVVVVLGARAKEVRAALGPDLDARVRCVTCASWAKGQSASLRAGLAAVDPRAAAAAILLGDQPDLDAATIDAVIEAFQAADRPAARPVYPDAGGVPGHPVVLARSLFEAATAQGGDRGARALFDAHPERLLCVPMPGASPSDVDTPADAARLREVSDPPANG